ncbi:MAG: serine/threonine protein kinase [Ktedonobacterales bacterium]|nr:serine/threonine protein kinase [Ktedonobacterales bacterium]
MAQVYLARDTRLGREVAVKVLDRRLAERTGFRERFLREARVAAALDHPNIVPLYDYGETDALYLVMPYVSGGSLQDLLKRGPLPAGEVATYGAQIADALAYAHQRNVAHRDVKPANMLLHADGRVMLSDFGLAKILDVTAPPTEPRGRPDAGTPEYMAPEQIEGRTEARSDIYALGVVLYLLLTGHLPFTGATSSAVMEGHLYRLPEPPRRRNAAVSPAMEAVVLRALAKHPEDRYQNASDLGAALLSALVAGDAEPLPFADTPSAPPLSPPLGISQVPSRLAQPSFGESRTNYSSGGPAPRRVTASVLPRLDGPMVSQRSPHPSSSMGRMSLGGDSQGSASQGGMGGRVSSFPPALQPGYMTPPPTFEVVPLAPFLSPPTVAMTAQPQLGSSQESFPAALESPSRSPRFWLAVAVLVMLLALAAFLLVQWLQSSPGVAL